jgi:hypothetical protein
LGRWNEIERNWKRKLPASKGRVMHRALWWNRLNERNYLEITDPDDRVIKKGS